MDVERVVEVWAKATRRVGSGYLLTERLVLTSYHVLRGLEAGAPVEVRRLSRDPEPPEWINSHVRWPSSPVDIDAAPWRDAALLLLDEAVTVVPQGRVRFGETGDDRLPCQGLGFPRSEARPSGRRDTARILGEVDPLHALRSGVLTVHVNQGIVPPAGGWSGASGTALFCGPLLIAVLVTDRGTGAQADVLGAVPITALADEPDFRAAMEQHGASLVLERASLPDNEPLLELYLRALRRSVRDQPYEGVPDDQGQARPLPFLSDIYLPQGLLPWPGPESDPDMATWVGAEVPSVGGPHTEQLRTSVDEGIVVGDPGGGKSSLLRTRADALAERASQGTTDVIPVLVQAVALVPKSGERRRLLPQALAAAVNEELSGYGLHVPATPEFFSTRPRPSSHWLILVDGLDEVSAAGDRAWLLGALAHLDRPTYRFLVTTRPAPKAELDAAGPAVPRYLLQPFTPGDLHTVVTRWFTALNHPYPEQATAGLLRDLDRARLHGPASLPLTTAMLCQIYAALPAASLPSSRGDLYDTFLFFRLRQANEQGNLRTASLAVLGERSGRVLRAAEVVLTSLETLLEELATVRRAGSSGSAVTIVSRTKQAGLPRDERGYELISLDDWSRFLHFVLCHSGLLTAQGGDLVFLHPTYEEHLAARRMARDPGQLRLLFGSPRRYRRREPPAEDDSYVGFVIDAAQKVDQTESTRPLARLASGLSGCRFLAAQVRLGTAIPESVVDAAAERCHKELAGARARGNFSLPTVVQARDTLARLGGRRAGELMALLVRDEFADPNVRIWAVGSLIGLDDEHTPDAVLAVAADRGVLESSWDNVVATLIRFGGPQAVAAAAAVASREGLGGGYRARAVQVLAQLGDPRAASLAQTITLDSSHHERVRTAALDVLVKLEDPMAHDTARLLVRDFAAGTRLRVQAVKALAELGAPDAASSVLSVVRDPGLDRQSHRTVIGVLALCGSPEGASAAAELAAEPDLSPDLQAEAVAVLGELKDPRTAAFATALAEAPEQHGAVQERAVTALAQCGDEDSIGALSELLTLTPRLSADALITALQALARLEHPRIGDLALHVATDSYAPSEARIAALGILDRMRHPHAAHTATAIAQDDLLDDYIRMTAVEMLADRSDDRTADLAFALATDTFYDEVRIAATGVLVALNDPRADNLMYDLRDTIALHRALQDREARYWAEYGDLGSLEGGGLVESAAEQARDIDREDN